MATRKVTVTLSEDLVEALSAAAAREGIPLSRLVSRATERELRLRAAREFVEQWQESNGEFTEEELAQTRAELAAAEASALAWRAEHAERESA